MECVKLGTAAKGLVGEEAVGRCVHSEHKCWEVHQHTGFISLIEAAATLGEVGAEAVEGHPMPETWRALRTKTCWPLRETAADSRPKTGMKALLPIQT